VALWRHDDGHEREMAKWAHYRLVSARRQAEESERQELPDLDESPCSAVTEPESLTGD
jgi:hypothetical protein